MDVDAMQVFTSLLSLVALAGAGAFVVLRLCAARSPACASLGAGVARLSTWLAWLIAAVATAGSLYFSEVADYIPCRLCWFQRVAMYPLAAILLVGALRRDRGVVWYAVPIAAIGALVSSYHYLLEWNPSLEGDACTATGPACADIWFRELGFITLAFMALAGFVSIIVFVTLGTTWPTEPQPAADAAPAAGTFDGDGDGDVPSVEAASATSIDDEVIAPLEHKEHL